MPKAKVDWPALSEGLPEEWFPALIFDLGVQMDLKSIKKTKFDHEPISTLVERPLPAIKSISYRLVDKGYGLLEMQDMFLLPPWLDEDAIAELAKGEGMKVSDFRNAAVETPRALETLFQASSRAATIVAHGLSNDLKHINVDVERSGLSGGLNNQAHQFCTMINGAHITGVKHPSGVFKWPKLRELYERIWGVSCYQTKSHISSQDADYCAECYFGMWLLDGGLKPSELVAPDFPPLRIGLEFLIDAGN